MKRLIQTVVVILLLFVPAAAEASSTVLKIVIDDMIHPISDEFIGRAISEATAMGDDALLIEFRTPGGLVDSTRSIVNQILASDVPVIIWVTPAGSQAASAGFFILTAADVAAMAPGTNTGAAHPVMIGAEEVDEIMMEKLANDTAAFIRSVASKRGRNVELAESAVMESKSFSDQEALDGGLIDIIAESREDLFAQISGRTITRFDGKETILDLSQVEVRTLEMTLRQRLLSFIMNPNVAFLLFTIGMIGIWAELNNPGAILPGVVGVLSILLAVFALNILPTRYAALALIVLGFALLLLEAKFVSHGVFGTGGVIAVFIGGLLLVDGPIPEMRVHWLTALAVSIPFGIIAIFLMTLVFKAHNKQVTTGDEGMVGELGVAETDLRPEGRVFVHGEIWTAVSAIEIEQGSRIVVRNVTKGMRLEVEPVTETEGSDPDPAPAV